MSATPQGGAGRREVAYRLFAAEFDDADFEHTEHEDQERAPNYVITPTGARVNRLFVVGVLTEVERVNEDMVRGRIVDPTGAFVVYAGQYQPDQLTALERLEPPAFVAVTGKARTFRPEDSDVTYTSIRPESITAVDAETRDRWTVEAARHTVDRIATVANALKRSEQGDELRSALETDGVTSGFAAGISLALDHYGTTAAYLDALRTTAVQAAEVVANERDEVEPLDIQPDESGDISPADIPSKPLFERTPTPVHREQTEAANRESQVADTATVTQTDDSESAPSGTGELGADTTSPESGTSEDEIESSTPDETTDELYEFDDAEREEIESEFDTDFSTGSEIESPEESDREAPSPEAETSVDDEPSEQSTVSSVSTQETTKPEDTDDSIEDESTASDDTEQPKTDVDLEAAVVEAMRELDDGDGASRDAVVESVRTEYEVSESAVDNAIDDALMSGKCYEPGEDRFKAI